MFGHILSQMSPLKCLSGFAGAPIARNFSNDIIGLPVAISSPQRQSDQRPSKEKSWATARKRSNWT
jgi:hypothetical protein